VALLPVDRDLLQRCLRKQPGAWNDFVDRYLSLIYHVIGYTAHLRSAKVNAEDVEDIAAEVMLQIVADDYKVLRQFRGNATLATYLTVIARRICVHELTRRQTVRDAIRKGDVKVDDVPDSFEGSLAEIKGLERLDEVDRLLRKLSGKEREIVRLFYLEGRTYEEISTETGVPVNTIGAVLSRAREKLRKYRKSATDIPVLTKADIRAANANARKPEMKTGESK
jgi:RNA polymerase sigma-70 factor (ECF subfamily)